MSKCVGCGFYQTACQCRIDNNYCRYCNRIISDCRCSNHKDHWQYDNPETYKFDDDDPCNMGHSDSDKNDDKGSAGSGGDD